MFMGTPHQGGNGVRLGQFLANITSLFIAADDHLLQHLKRDSEWLQQQLGQYGPISGDFVTKFAYEEYKTSTAFGHSIMVSNLTTTLEKLLNRCRLYLKHRQSFRARQTLSLSSSIRIIIIW